MLFVEKFGGSSLAGVERVRCAARLIADTVRAGHSVAAVLSAQGKTTDALLSTAAHYSRSPSKRELDMLLATGEQASVALMAMTLEEMGLPAVSLTGWQAGVGTDETYGDAHIRRLSMERVRCELDEGKVVLIAGFQGVSPGNDITTLGRGGSDTTAVAAAAALRADECRIYTDVEGVFTADPRLIPEARRLSAVEALVKSPMDREELILALTGISDMERLIGRMVYGSALRTTASRSWPMPAPRRARP